TKGAALLFAAGDGPVADGIRVGPVEPAAGLGVLDVALRTQAALDHVTGAGRQELAQLFGVEMVAARFAGAGGNLAEQFFHKGPDVGFDLPVGKVGADETDPALDVVP